MIIVALIVMLVWGLLSNVPIIISGIAAAGLIIIAFVIIRYTISPDRVRALQTKRTLSLASTMLEHLSEGLNAQSAQAVCEIILPETQAQAVEISNGETTLGRHGMRVKGTPARQLYAPLKRAILAGAPMRVISSPTKYIEERIAEGDLRDMLHVTNGTLSGDEMPGLIIAPLNVRDVCMGTLSFYYSQPHLIDATQREIAHGLALLLSTQLSTSELDRQAELATRAELKALQSQINPHFLFNTLNTISALIRTDPPRARELLRDFSMFYRQTLENSVSLITLERELIQTERYMHIERARFGDNRVRLLTEVEPGLEQIMVPSFIVQPIIENAVQHAMPPQGLLTISLKVTSNDPDVIIEVIDDGRGMTEDVLQSLGNPKPSEKGTGIALKNVSERLKGFFNSDSSITISSEPDRGTVVQLRLAGAFAKGTHHDA